MCQWIRSLLQWLLRLLGGAETPSKAEAPPSTAPVTVVTLPAATPELGLASAEAPRYRKSDSLFSYRERIFYGALLDAVDKQYWTFAKVRLADIMWLTNEPENKKFHANQILCKHVDFLLCEKKTYRPLLAIELDDSSHTTAYRRERDEFKDRTFAAIGLPLLRVSLQSAYSVPDLKQQIHGKMRETAS